MSERNVNIDVIKICACLGVCTLHMYVKHLIIDSTFRLEYVLFYASTIAMPLFFMVNGFLLLGKERSSQYYFKRIINIIKIVFLINCIYFVGTWLLYGKIVVNPFTETILNLFYQEGLFRIFWFFGSLICIYILMSLIPYQCLSTKVMVAAIISLTLISLFANISNILTRSESERIFESYIPQTFRLYNHLNYFLIGGVLSRQTRYNLSHIPVKYVYFAILSVVVCTISATLKCYTLYEVTWVPYLHSSIVTTFGAFSAFLLLMQIDVAESHKKILSTLGDEVIIVYILHMVVLHFVPINIVPSIIYLPCFWIICFTAGYLLNRVKIIRVFLKI